MSNHDIRAAEQNDWLHQIFGSDALGGRMASALEESYRASAREFLRSERLLQYTVRHAITMEVPTRRTIRDVPEVEEWQTRSFHFLEEDYLHCTEIPITYENFERYGAYFREYWAHRRYKKRLSAHRRRMRMAQEEQQRIEQWCTFLADRLGDENYTRFLPY